MLHRMRREWGMDTWGGSPGYGLNEDVKIISEEQGIFRYDWAASPPGD
jgi:hypothetical protein